MASDTDFWERYEKELQKEIQNLVDKGFSKERAEEIIENFS